MNKDIELSDKFLKKKKDFLLGLKSEIEDLQNKLSNIKRDNKRIKCKKGIKKIGCYNRLLLPFYMGYSLTYLIFSIINHKPFERDDYKSYLRIKKEIDSLGNTKIEEQYRSYNENYNIFKYASKWEMNDDGTFVRSVKEYNAKLDEEALVKMIETKDIYNLDVIFGEPKNVYIETRSNVLKEELDEECFLEAIIYLSDKDETIIIKETNYENFVLSFLYLTFSIVPSMGFTIINSNFILRKALREIDEKYPEINANDLLKELEIKMNNYQVLTREK